jgi:hypothetical protein
MGRLAVILHISRRQHGALGEAGELGSVALKQRRGTNGAERIGAGIAF